MERKGYVLSIGQRLKGLSSGKVRTGEELRGVDSKGVDRIAMERKGITFPSGGIANEKI